jgi:hypothetical protein
MTPCDSPLVRKKTHIENVPPHPFGFWPVSFANENTIRFPSEPTGKSFHPGANPLQGESLASWVPLAK